MLSAFKFSLTAVSKHLPIVITLCVLIVAVLLFISLRAGVNPLLSAIAYIPAALAFIIGSSCIVFLLAFVISFFDFAYSLKLIISIVLSYPISLALAFVVLQRFR